MKEGPEEDEVPTSTVDVRTVWTVPAIAVLATLTFQDPVRVELDGFGAKHDLPLFSSTEEANAPEESSCI